MILFKKADALTKYLRTKSEIGDSIGFVPTMGALHEGHLQLVQTARQQSSVTVVSIFVNPTQFNDPRDFEKYPITVETDIAALDKAGCDVLFLPDVHEIYPGGTAELPHYNLGDLETILEGLYRPGHFQGVCQVMDRLLGIVMPNLLFMGQKDYQQCMVIGRLIELRKWSMELKLLPTVREPSGLAMSSRNRRLSPALQQQAAAIYQMLQWLRTTIIPGPLQSCLTSAAQQLRDAGFEKIDYISICNASTLQPLEEWDGKTPVVALTAAFIGGVRLIDNLLLTQA